MLVPYSKEATLHNNNKYRGGPQLLGYVPLWHFKDIPPALDRLKRRCQGQHQSITAAHA